MSAAYARPVAEVEGTGCWDTDLNQSIDCLLYLDPFCIIALYAMFCFVFSVRIYTNKILFKPKIVLVAPGRIL